MEETKFHDPRSVRAKTRRAARLTARAVCAAVRHARLLKIKLKSVGYRLVYQVEDEVLIVLVIAVGKREQSKVYKAAARRLD